VLPPEARRTAIDFIHAAVTRDPAGWKLLDRTFPFPRFRRVRFEYIEATPRRSSLIVVFDQRAAFQMSLKRHGTRWLVDWFDIAWGPPSATCPGQAFG
jgi:hypothetical protein